MDARLIRAALVLSVMYAGGANYRTQNFVVTAPTQEIAQQVAEVAEHSRDELAVLWLGKKMDPWSKPCPIKVKVGQIGAGGATTFAFDRGEVFGWNMNVQGTLERILDSVVPHEVSHTVFASYYRRPLPRWADEGAATLVEHESERKRQQLLLDQVRKSRRGIPLNTLLAMKEYPSDMNDVLTLYAQGYSLADYLVEKGGRKRFLQFLQDAHNRGWQAAIQQHYKMDGVDSLETNWNSWIVAGSPRLNLPKGQMLADAGAQQQKQPVIRSQSPEPRRAAPSQAANQQRQPGRRVEAPEPRRQAPAEIAAAALPLSNRSAQPAAEPAPADKRLPRPRPLAVAVRANQGDKASPPLERYTRGSETAAKPLTGSGAPQSSPQDFQVNP